MIILKIDRELYISDVGYIVITTLVYTLMNTKSRAFFNNAERMTTIRAAVRNRFIGMMIFPEVLTTYFTLILTFTTIVIVDVMMRSTTTRARNMLRDGTFITSRDRLEGFTIFQKRIVLNVYTTFFVRGDEK